MKTLAYLAWFAGACALALAQDNKKAAASPGAQNATIGAIDRGHEAYLSAMRANDAKALVALLATSAAGRVSPGPTNSFRASFPTSG